MVRKGKKYACATGKEKAFWARPIPRFYKVYTKIMTIRAKLSKTSQIISSDGRNLIVPCEIHYRDRSSAFNAYQLLHLCRRWKAGSGIGKVARGTLARSMYPHLTEDSEIFFEVEFWRCWCSKYDGQPVIIGMTDEGPQLREEVGGVSETFITILVLPTVKQEYKIFINQTD